jgi:hypothetical protein
MPWFGAMAYSGRRSSSCWVTLSVGSRPATITARKSRTVRPVPPPESGIAHASSNGTSCSSACTRRGHARNWRGSIRVVKRCPYCRLQVMEQSH